jgi:L-lactate utilization protein LutC
LAFEGPQTGLEYGIVFQRIFMTNRPNDRRFRASLRSSAVAMALVFALTISGSQCRAESADGSSSDLKEADEALLARQQWQEQVRAEKRRIRELAIQRRLDPEVETAVSQERRASERALNDMTLRRGDIVVTDKGSFVFIGKAEQDRMPGDFVPVEPKQP